MIKEVNSKQYNVIKNKRKEDMGITLIALVITIIVLLILAGISIAMLTGNNGILTQAKLAKENTVLAKQDEENKLANNNKYINEQLGKVVPGKRVLETEKDNYVDSNGDKATVPAGFTVSKIAEEQKVSEGLVIYDIPEEELANVDWTTKNDDGAYNVQTLYNQFVWIPVASEEEYQRDFSYPTVYDNNTYGTFTDTEYLPTEIASEVDSADVNEKVEKEAVLKYNGFFIARYETGIENNEVVSKQNAIVYVNESQITFKEIGKRMYNENSKYVKSAMCSGIQWDMTMKFIDKEKDGNGNIYDVREYDETRHTGEKEKSGKNAADRVQNIYDLEGNCTEYVAERNSTMSTFIYRGGEYNKGDYNKASKRHNNQGYAHSSNSFRLVIYII